MHNVGLKSGRINLAGALPNVLYVPSTIAERNMFVLLRSKLRDLTSAAKQNGLVVNTTAINTGDSAHITGIPDNAVDYIFVDPPFGSNLQYSELSELWEIWLGVRTNSQPEAIISKHQGKHIQIYGQLMERCFNRFYRILKPSGWITVEFHNSKSKVWNVIQQALMRAGFVVTTVRILDKGQGTRNQMTQDGSVDKDLAITAYKPRDGFVTSFQSQAGDESAVWLFVADYLAQLPMPQVRDSILECIGERRNYLLYDRMVAYHIQSGVEVPLGATQFYTGLKARFAERDSMYFLPDQVAEYDKARLTADSVDQLPLFVKDEKTAITWLRVLLSEDPQTFSDLHPRFLTELHQVPYEDLPDLRLLLEQNFLHDEQGRYYVPDPANAEDLEKLRRRALLQEFATYRQARKRLKIFRTEAIRAGFAQAYVENDFAAIRDVAALLPDTMVQEDQELLMYVDAASLRE